MCKLSMYLFEVFANSDLVSVFICSVLYVLYIFSGLPFMLFSDFTDFLCYLFCY